MRNFKRAITAFIAVALVAASLSGCTAPSNDSTGSTTSASSAGSTTDGKKETKKVSYTALSYYTGAAAPEATPVNDEVEKLILEKLGYDVDVKNEYVHFGDYKEKLKVLMAGGSVPDWIQVGWYPLADLIKYGEQGLFVELTANKDKLPDFFSSLEQSTVVKNEAFTSSGELYIFPNAVAFPDGNFDLAYGSVFRKDILDKHNLEVPETLDDMYTVAMALKKEYPNIYPIITYEDWEPIETAIFGANKTTSAYDTVSGVYFNGEKFVYGPTEEGYKDGLIYLNKCYKDKLIAPDFMTHTAEQGKATLSKGEAFLMPKAWTGYPSEWNKEYPDQEYVLVPSLSNEKYGEPWTFTNSSNDTMSFNTSYYQVVSEKSKVKNELLDIMNLEYTKEVLDLRAWGIKDQSYTIDANGEYALTDKYIQDKTLLAKLGANPPSNRLVGKFLTDKNNIFYDGKMLGEVDLYDFVRDSFDEKRKAPVAPKIVLSTDENEEYASITTAVDTFAKEQKAKFIMGERSFDEWDKYLAELAKMGDIQRALDIKNSKIK